MSSVSRMSEEKPHFCKHHMIIYVKQEPDSMDTR